jgi:hypothetical protein
LSRYRGNYRIALKRGKICSGIFLNETWARLPDSQPKDIRMIARNMTRRNLLMALAGASGAVVTNAVAQKPATPPQPDRFALVNNNVKELLLLMDTDKNGKISKQEWMNFMEAEFNQLDKDGKGELDPKQLSQSRLVIKHNNS